MNGFGIREQWAAGRSLRHQRLWRDDILLHQLTVNGSLLLVDNTDELFRALLAPTLAQPADTPWSALRELLRLLPAHLARRVLWRASLRWWTTVAAVQLAQQTFALRDGRLDELAQSPDQQAVSRRLSRLAELLDELAWCNSASDADETRIQVADLREAQRQAAARHKPNIESRAKTRRSVTS